MTYKVDGTSVSFTHTVGSPTTYYYRVRATDSCGGSTYMSSWSDTARRRSQRCVDLTLTSQTILTTVVHEACGTITAGPRLRWFHWAPDAARATHVVLRNGFSVGAGARLTVAIDASLAGT
jgi:hypothetical protein